MNQILDGIDSVVTAISGVLYMPWVPLLLLAAGLFFTFRSKFIQIRLLGESFRVVSEKPKTKGSISSFGALMISTASRVGTGNIVGVSTAICLGGYGAVFWMWVTAILGGASAFVESPWPKSISGRTRTAAATAVPPTTWKPPCGSAGLGSSSPSSLS